MLLILILQRCCFSKYHKFECEFATIAPKGNPNINQHYKFSKP